MKVIILGAGQVGASVAEGLVSEENDITIVDQDAAPLRHLQDRLDLRTVQGNAASPSVLREAGVEDADLVIAATQSDPTNLVACKMAHCLFNVPARIARLRSPDILDDPHLLTDDNFAVSHAICPEQIVTDYIAELVALPGALQVLEFARGRVTLVGGRAYEGGLLVGKPIREMQRHLPSGVDARIAAIYRGDQAIAPEGDTIIQTGDEVFVLAAAEHIRKIMLELRRLMKPVRRIMIGGAGNIGLRVATVLERDYEVKVIESRRERAELVAQRLGKTLVLSGDTTDEELLEEENIRDMDLFLALTNDDENNIMSASLAKRLGCKRVVALVNRRAYAEMIEGGPIDIAISPAHVSIGSMLAHVRRGDVATVHSLRRGAAEALEVVAHGDARSCSVVGRRIADIDWPSGVTVAALVRDFDRFEVVRVRDDGTAERRPGRVFIAHGDTVIETGDHVIIFCVNKSLVRKIEALFQVGVSFL